MTTLDGRHFRGLRKKAHLTLVEVGRLCRLSPSHLSAMEVGEHPFKPEIAALYERLFDRRRKAGDE